MKCIVEPDKLSAVLGLLGVIAGALLAGAGAWILQGRTDRRNSRREVSRAAADLLASADALRMTVNGFVVANADSQTWVPLISTTLERMDKAELTIASLSEQPLVGAADELAKAARDFAHSYGKPADPEALKTKIDAFSGAARNLKA